MSVDQRILAVHAGVFAIGGDFHASGTGGRMHPAEVAHPVLSRRQDVLEISMR